MRKNNHSYSASDVVIMTGIICFFLFMFRLWPLIVVALFVGLFLTVKRVLLTSKNQESIQEKEQAPKVEVPVETDYEHIIKSISFYVNDAYPNAQWIWEKPNSRMQIQNGEEIYVRLNKAGEYRRVKVCMQGQQVVGIEILPYVNEEQDISPLEMMAQRDDRESVAFDWVDSHIAELNEKCNEVIGQGNNELILTIEELPEEKYWEHVRDELVKAGLESVEVVSNEGIKIKLK